MVTMWYADREGVSEIRVSGMDAGFLHVGANYPLIGPNHAICTTREQAVLWRAKTLASDLIQIESEKKALAEREAGVLRQAQTDVPQDVVKIVKQRVPESSYVFEISPEEVGRTPKMMQEIAANQNRARACETPATAYEYARNIEGPSDETRAAACRDAACAYVYARYVDECPRPDTRAAACKDALYAYMYALIVDKGPRDDTRRAACRDAKSAYLYALNVDECRRDDTREAASRDPHWKRMYEESFPLPKFSCPIEAYDYALENGPCDASRAKACKDAGYAYLYACNVDRGSHNDTRAAACEDAKTAYKYALNVDRGSQDDTRRAACRLAGYAYLYALNVDKGFHNDTWNTIKSDLAYCGAYLELLSVKS